MTTWLINGGIIAADMHAPENVSLLQHQIKRLANRLTRIADSDGRMRAWSNFYPNNVFTHDRLGLRFHFPNFKVLWSQYPIILTASSSRTFFSFYSVYKSPLQKQYPKTNKTKRLRFYHIQSVVYHAEICWAH